MHVAQPVADLLHALEALCCHAANATAALDQGVNRICLPQTAPWLHPQQTVRTEPARPSAPDGPRLHRGQTYASSPMGGALAKYVSAFVEAIDHDLAELAGESHRDDCLREASDLVDRAARRRRPVHRRRSCERTLDDIGALLSPR